MAIGKIEYFAQTLDTFFVGQPVANSIPDTVG